MTLKQVGQLPTWDNLVLRHKIPPQNVLPSVEISDGGLGGAHVASGGGLMLKVEQQQSTRNVADVLVFCSVWVFCPYE